jgi:DNA polymerase III delta prime subunit
MKTWESILRTLVSGMVFPQLVHRVLIYGPPGTGKSTVAYRLFPARDVEAIAMSRDMQREGLTGGMGLKDGSTVAVAAYAARAMKDGLPLVLDEIDQFSEEVRPVLHEVLDSWEQARCSLPDGTIVRPAEGYCVIATTNELPSSLPPALLDRFDVVLCADRPDESYSCGDAAIDEFLRNRRENAEAWRWFRELTPRTARSLATLRRAIDGDTAIHVVCGQVSDDSLRCALVACEVIAVKK